MTDSVIITMSGGVGEVRARNIGHGVVSWECRKHNATGVTDIPKGWYKPRNKWNALDKETWDAFLAEIRECVLADYS
jgi:hypothetical protein